MQKLSRPPCGLKFKLSCVGYTTFGSEGTERYGSVQEIDKFILLPVQIN